MLIAILLAASAVETAEKPLVLHRTDDRPVAVLARMVGLLGADAEDFDLRSVSEWVWSLEAIYDGGTVSKCEGDLLPGAAFDALLDEAIDAVQFFKPEVAVAALRSFDQRLRCAGEVVPRGTLGRAFFIEGVVQATLGEERAASVAFEHARSMDPEMRWDSDMAPDSRPLFEAASPGTDTAWLRIAPKPERVWVDGESVSYGDRGVRIALGRHVISADIEGVASADVRVERDGSLLLPGLLNDGVVAQLANPGRQQIIRRFVKFSGISTVYFTNVDQVWRVRDGGVHALVAKDEQPAVVKPLRRRGAYTPLGAIIGGTGLALAGVGTALVLTSDKPAPGMVLLATGGALAVGGGTVIAVDQLVVSPGDLRVGVRLGARL